MARLFSININFGNKDYTGLVNVRESGNDLHCIVRYVDKELRYIIPGDCIEFCLEEGLKQPKHLPTQLAESLLISTTTALANHYATKE